ncbi:pseudaminic acid synthase [Exilibacterium tricleocarpae]|uniref:Pseudaminic acid synthase n=1 Tax=Exilibacterium tricleocarpae TaxID=2591008 RepID=A0A545U4C1_9GAMM|nr:pseudaminic acid synthase [Exilibacterium tricleocarpae]TQV84315.1 pseudaminic acid synthase [Exilibacterium tricleocarpae]
MLQSIALADKTIGTGHKPFIIAEMSGNHNQSLERALALVDAAAAAGAHALKLQTYTADTMTIDCSAGEFVVDDPAGLWRGRSLHELYREAYTPWEWHAPLFERCRQRGIIGFSTPFDASAVEFLERLEVPFYKIASFENTDIPLLKCVAATGKPIIMSTGMASVAELETSVTALREAGCEQLILLKCTSTYPAAPGTTNILTIPHMRALFQCHVGLSDHTMGVGVAVASVALGAPVIEKHFTLRRADGGVDAGFSLEPPELRQLVVETERAHQALGQVSYGAAGDEVKMRNYRRSLYIAAAVRAGERLSHANVRVIRPGLGLAPKHLDEVLGQRVRVDLDAGTALQWQHLE